MFLLPYNRFHQLFCLIICIIFRRQFLTASVTSDLSQFIFNEAGKKSQVKFFAFISSVSFHAPSYIHIDTHIDLWVHTQKEKEKRMNRNTNYYMTCGDSRANLHSRTDVLMGLYAPLGFLVTVPHQVVLSSPQFTDDGKSGGFQNLSQYCRLH